MPRRIPVFPLGTVLFPYSLLPLHIFEQRYRTLIAVLLGDRPDDNAVPEMGVVLIERGHEVGGGDVRTGVGTIAGLMRVERFPDGRYFALAVGMRRFEVVGWFPDDPYPLAEVEELPEEVWDASSDGLLREAEQEVRRVVSLAGELGEPVVQPELSPDPVTASWQLCAAVPVGTFDHQQLLCAPGHSARLELLAGQAREAASLFAFRLGGA